jgi:hypothetical protein
VARAKRTQRAEARRRYRAASAPDEATDPGDDAAPASTSGRGKTAATEPGGTPTRMGMGNAFRASFRPLNLRQDIAALPQLVLSKALWIPVLVTVVGTATIISAARSTMGLFIFQNLIEAPVIPAFIAGMLATRASWLIGVLVGLVSAACYSVLVVAFPTSISSTVPTDAQMQELVIRAFVVSPIWGAFFASAAAWYRRFLRLSSPNRGRQAPSQKKAGDGRTRGGGTSQKASAKR